MLRLHVPSAVPGPVPVEEPHGPRGLRRSVAARGPHAALQGLRQPQEPHRQLLAVSCSPSSSSLWPRPCSTCVPPRVKDGALRPGKLLRLPASLRDVTVHGVRGEPQGVPGDDAGALPQPALRLLQLQDGPPRGGARGLRLVRLPRGPRRDARLPPRTLGARTHLADGDGRRLRRAQERRRQQIARAVTSLNLLLNYNTQLFLLTSPHNSFALCSIPSTFFSAVPFPPTFPFPHKYLISSLLHSFFFSDILSSFSHYYFRRFLRPIFHSAVFLVSFFFLLIPL